MMFTKLALGLVTKTMWAEPWTLRLSQMGYIPGVPNARLRNTATYTNFLTKKDHSTEQHLQQGLCGHLGWVLPCTMQGV